MTKSSCIVIAFVTACASGGKPGAAPDTGGDDQPDAPGRPDAADPDAPSHVDAAMPDAPQQPVTVTLQETTNNSILQGNSAPCNYSDVFGNITGTADNTWYRAYQLSDFNITNAFHVTQVTFGVEISTAATAQVKVGSYTGTVGGATIDLGQVTPLAAAPGTGRGAHADEHGRDGAGADHGGHPRRRQARRDDRAAGLRQQQRQGPVYRLHECRRDEARILVVVEMRSGDSRDHGSRRVPRGKHDHPRHRHSPDVMPTRA